MTSKQLLVYILKPNNHFRWREWPSTLKRQESERMQREIKRNELEEEERRKEEEDKIERIKTIKLWEEINAN